MNNFEKSFEWMKIKIHQDCQMSINLIQNNKSNFIKDLREGLSTH